MTLNELAQQYLHNLQIKCTRENPNTDMNQLSAIKPVSAKPDGYTHIQDESYVENIYNEYDVIQNGVE